MPADLQGDQTRAVMPADSAAELLTAGRQARAKGDRILALDHFTAAAAVSREPWPALERAQTLRELGRLPEATTAYQAILADHPGQLHALMGLGYTSRSAGNHAAALDHFSAAAEVAPDDDPWPRLERAGTLLAIGRPDDAEAGYAALIEGHEGHFAVHLGLGSVLRTRGDHAAALVHFTAAADAAPPGNPWPRLECANALRTLGRLDEAEDSYRKVLDSHPNQTQALTGLAHTARLRGDSAAALERFSEAAALASPGDPWAQLEQANLLRGLGRLREAEATYEAVLVAHPDHFGALLGLGHVARADGPHVRALSHFAAAVQVAPEADPWPELEQAGTLRQLGRLDEAEASYRRVMARHPGHFAALTGLGRLAAARGDAQAALSHLSAAAAAAPAGAHGPHLELADQHRAAGDYDEARRIVRRLLDQRIAVTEAWMSLGHIERAARHHREALAAFQQARLSDPGNVLPMVQTAIVLRELGEPDSARRLLEQALELAPQSEPVLLELAELAWRARDHAAAVSLYHEVIALRPLSLQAYLGAARSLVELGERRETLALLDDAEGLCGPSPHITFLRLDLMYQSGDWQRALALARDAFTAAPKDFWLWYQRFRFEKLLSSPTMLTACLARAPATSAEALLRLQHCRGQAAEEDWRIDEAIEHYERARLIRQDDPWLLIDLARARLLALDLDGATEAMKQQVRAEAPNTLLLGRSLKVSQTHLGQILNEFMIEPEAVARLAAQRGQTPQRRIAAFLTMIPEFPEYTPVTMALLVALRQAGQLTALHSGETGWNPAMPQSIMQYWDDPHPPSDVTDLMQGWRAAHPKFAYALFSDVDAQAFLKQNFVPPVLEAYQRSAELAQKADLFRLAYLFAKGGTYIDADDRCLAPLHTVMPKQAGLVLYQEDYGTVGNNFIAALPRHPVIGAALGQLVNAVNRGDRDILWFASGPGLLTRAVAQHLAKSAAPIADSLKAIRILSRVELHRAVAMHCKVTYKQTDRHWSNTSFRRNRDRPADRPPDPGHHPSAGASHSSETSSPD